MALDGRVNSAIGALLRASVTADHPDRLALIAALELLIKRIKQHEERLQAAEAIASDQPQLPLCRTG
jgi:hypothetical protein